MHSTNTNTYQLSDEPIQIIFEIFNEFFIVFKIYT